MGQQLLGVKDDRVERLGSRKDADGGMTRPWTFQMGEGPEWHGCPLCCWAHRGYRTRDHC